MLCLWISSFFLVGLKFYMAASRATKLLPLKIHKNKFFVHIWFLSAYVCLFVRLRRLKNKTKKIKKRIKLSFLSIFCICLQMYVCSSKYDVWTIKKKKKYKNKLFVHVLCLSAYVCLFLRIWHMQSSPFREWEGCYTNIFQAPLCCHAGRVTLSGSEMFIIQIFSKHHKAATKTEFPFQG